jgi:hypothetical protein
MSELIEDQLAFTFPDNWSVTKYDEWSFYRNQFQNCCCGNKAVDFIALTQDNILWLIEIKDYRGVLERSKDIELWDEIALKVRDTLAGLLAAKMDTTHDNTAFANSALNSKKLRVVLHLEQPVQHSKLFPRLFNRSIIQQKIKQLIKPIDAHPIVLESTQMSGVAWSVRSIGAN